LKDKTIQVPEWWNDKNSNG
jgi:hypothetical protein